MKREKIFTGIDKAKGYSKTVRFIVSYRKVSFWKCFSQWLHYLLKGSWVWETHQAIYSPVYPGDSEYENAPYGLNIIWHKSGQPHK